MNHLHVAVLTQPPSPTDATAMTLLDRITDTSNRGWQDVYDTTDFDHPRGHAARQLAAQQSADLALFVAFSGPEPEGARRWSGLPVVDAAVHGDRQVLGTTWARHSRGANAHVVDDLEFGVPVELRRRGIATALLAAVESAARAWGATQLRGWGAHHEGGSGDLSAPPLGVLVAHDAGTDFALARGFRIAQAEQLSTWHLERRPPDQVALPQGYRIIGWSDLCPDEWLTDMAALHTALHRDIPKGSLEVAEDVWDEQRVIDHDRDALVSHELRVCAVLHEPSGSLAGYTQLSRDRLTPGVAWQDTTVVAAEHRGRGLARAVKLANAHSIGTLWPQTVRIRTWNAAENKAMLSVNARIGFEPEMVTCAWSRTLG